MSWKDEHIVEYSLLDDVQLTLENDNRWYRWCLDHNTHIQTVDWQHFVNAVQYFYEPAAGLSLAEMTHLRKYFRWRYLTDQKTPPPEYRKVKTRKAVPVPVTPYPFQEKVMSMKFQTVHLLNGVDVSKLPKDELYAAIEVEEQRIEKLRKIKHQPKTLIAEIEAAEATLTALVAHLDGG